MTEINSFARGSKVFSVKGSLIIPPAPLEKMGELRGIAVKVPL
jgi:hypothetical protein